MTFRGHCFALLLAVLVSSPAGAQTDRIADLERRLDDLSRQMVVIREEVALLKAVQTPASPAASPSPALPGDDLTRVSILPVVQSAAPAPAPEPAPMTGVQTISNPANPGASKVFNPDTSVIGNFVGKAGRPNPYEFGAGELRPTMQLSEAEIGFEAFVDPYMKGKFFLAASPEGLEIEEGYAQLLSLPYDMTAKVGRVKAAFGKANTWHTHARPWVDQPLVIHNFFGDEQLADSGVSVSRILPAKTLFLEATAEVFRGNVAGVFEHRSPNDLFYNAHLKAFRDMTDNGNLELGGSYARGTTAGTGGRNAFGGIDLTYRWKPLERGLYNSLVARFEGIVDRRPGAGRTMRGFYAALDYQLGQRWYAGLRVDRAGRITSADGESLATPATDRGFSTTLTFWPSEFSQLRGQLRRTSYGDVRRTVSELLLQLQFSIGAHGAHTF